MAALTADRLGSVSRSGDRREPPVAAATLIFAGAMVGITTGNVAVPGAATATLKIIGVAAERVDNSAGAAGDKRVKAMTGIWRFANSSAGDLIALTDIGSPCYAVDDQTVAKTHNGNTRPIAGTIFDVDAQGVWVKFG